MLMRRLPLAERDVEELLRAAQERRDNWVTYAPYLDMMREALRDAELMPQEEWGGVARLGAGVRVGARGAGAGGRDWVLVRPRDEDEGRSRLSVLTPLGWELLGARAGEVVYAPAESGVKAYVVERVTAPGETSEPGRRFGE